MILRSFVMFKIQKRQPIYPPYLRFPNNLQSQTVTVYYNVLTNLTNFNNFLCFFLSSWLMNQILACPIYTPHTRPHLGYLFIIR